jgi:hypothetical protein
MTLPQTLLLVEINPLFGNLRDALSKSFVIPLYPQGFILCALQTTIETRRLEGK